MNLEAIKLQMQADKLHQSGNTAEACRGWTRAAEVLEKAGKSEAAKALRERVAHYSKEAP